VLQEYLFKIINNFFEARRFETTNIAIAAEVSSGASLHLKSGKRE
jgi:hypothetical protein